VKKIGRTLLLGAAILCASLPWVIGAPIIVLHPWDVGGTLSLTYANAPLAFTQLQMRALPPDLNWWANGQDTSTKEVTPVGPPYPWTMALEGGDPANADNTGYPYKFGLYATFANDQGYLQVYDEGVVPVVSGQATSLSATAAC
jgi:hypothetical protein